MKKTDVLVYFDNSQTKVAVFLNIQQPAVSQWGQIIPEKRALQLAARLAGRKRKGRALRYNPRLYKHKNSHKISRAAS